MKKSKAQKYFEARVDKRPNGALAEDVILARAVPTICDMYLIDIIAQLKKDLLKKKVTGVAIISISDVMKTLNDYKVKNKFITDLCLH